MTTRRRRTRSNSDNPKTNPNNAEEDENSPKDTDVLFGSCDFLESHPGTKEWASIVGSYSHQYYWSSSLYQKIRDDKRLVGKQYFVLVKKSKFRPATELEIEQRTSGVFDNGGGKKKQSRKRRASTGNVSTKGTTIVNGSEGREFQEGDNVFVYDQLWRAQVVEVGDFLDGVKFKVHFKGFLATSDQWVDRLQIFPYSETMKEIYDQIDKAEGTAFQGEYDAVETNGNEDDSVEEEEDLHSTGAKKRRKTQTKGKRGTVSRSCSKAAPTAVSSPRRLRSASNTSTAAASVDSTTNNDELNSICASDYNDVTKLASNGSSEILSHRLFSTKTKSAVNKHTRTTRASEAAPEFSTRVNASIDCDSTLDLSQIVTDALEKCEMAKQKAQDSGMTAVVPLLNGEAASWSLGAISRYLNVGEIQTNLPPLDQMQSNVENWKQEGGIKGLEAMAMERNIEKWNKAQEHLARFVECLVEDL